MPSTLPPKPEVQITPSQYLEFIRMGTGAELKPDLYADFCDKHGAPVARKIRKRLHDLTGHSSGELHRMAAENTTTKTIAAEKTRDGIRGRLLEVSKCAIEEIHGFSKAANDYITDIIRDYFPGEDHVLMNDEVATTSDPAKLFLLAFNDEYSAKIKFEAARKLLIMQAIKEVRDFSREEVDDEDALSYMTDFFNNRMLAVPEGGRIGDLTKRFLISYHDPETLQTMATEISDNPEVKPHPKWKIRVTPLDCRTAFVKDSHTSEERAILFRKHPRQKTEDSRLTKALRFGTLIGARDTDRNGIRLVFDTVEDVKAFLTKFKSELHAEISEGLQELYDNEPTESKLKAVYKSRLRSIEQSVIIHDEKNSLDGSEFNGSSSSSSSKFKVFKFKLELTKADGRQHHYEFQVFLPDGYADYLYRRGVSWEEYNVDRFFSEGVDELLFPSSIYPIDRKKLREKVLKQALQKAWIGNGNGGYSGTIHKEKNTSVPSPEPDQEQHGQTEK